MGNFRRDSDRGFGSRDRGNRGGFRGRGFGSRDRDSGFGERRRPEMHDVVCDKCGKNCQVPFKPSGDKPVLCSDCFRKDNNSSGSRDKSSGSGISQEQFKELNRKLDKILGILEMVEFEDVEAEEGEESELELENEDEAEEEKVEVNEDK